MIGNYERIFLYAKQKIDKLSKQITITNYYFLISKQVVELWEHPDTKLSTDSKFDSLQKTIKKASLMTESLKQDKYNFVYSQAVITLHSYLDLVTKSLIAEYFSSNGPSKIDVFNSITIDLNEYDDLDYREKGYFLYDIFKADKAFKRYWGPNRTERMFEKLGIVGDIHNDVFRLLCELTEARNIYVHNDGYVDSKMLKNCPWLRDYPPDQLLKLERENFDRYIAAVEYYFGSLIERLGGKPVDFGIYMDTLMDYHIKVRPKFQLPQIVPQDNGDLPF